MYFEPYLVGYSGPVVSIRAQWSLSRRIGQMYLEDVTLDSSESADLRSWGGASEKALIRDKLAR